MFLFLQFCLLAFSGLSMTQWWGWDKWQPCNEENGKECCVNCVNLCKDCKYCKRCFFSDLKCHVHRDCKYCHLCQECEKGGFCGRVCKMDDLPVRQPRYGFSCYNEDWRFAKSSGWILFVNSVSNSLIKTQSYDSKFVKIQLPKSWRNNSFNRVQRLGQFFTQTHLCDHSWKCQSGQTFNILRGINDETNFWPIFTGSQLRMANPGWVVKLHIKFSVFAQIFTQIYMWDHNWEWPTLAEWWRGAGI